MTANREDVMRGQNELKSETVNIRGMQEYLATYDNVMAAYLFGSAARGTLHHHSDVDVALLLAADLDRAMALSIRLQVAADLERICQRPVDVVVLNRAPPALCFQVIRDRHVLYEKDRDLRCLFEMKALNEYYDFEPYLTYQLSHLAARIRKEGLGAGYQGHRDALAEARQLSAKLAAVAKSVAR